MKNKITEKRELSGLLPLEYNSTGESDSTDGSDSENRVTFKWHKTNHDV